MGMARKFWPALGAAALLGGFATPVTSAAAAAKTITVTPHTNVAAGTNVQIVVHGFQANEQALAVMCAAPVVIPDSCDTSTIVSTSTDTHGSFTAHMVVHRHIATSTDIVDCAVHKCAIEALGNSPADEVSTPIQMSKTGGPHPTVHASPSTGLRDLQRIDVSGHGFPAADPMNVGECVAQSLESCVSINGTPGDGRGNFATSIPVRRAIDTPSGRVDCGKAKGACEVVALDPSNLDFLARTPLAFDTSVRPPPPASVTVLPATQLPYYASVRVRGANFTPGDTAFITECASATACDLPLDLIQIGPDGGFDISEIISRVTPGLDGPGTDCVKSPHCVIAVLDESSSGAVTTPIKFDPKAPVPPPASLAITPAGPYHDQQTVTITGRHFPPLAFLSVGECALSPSSESCFSTGGSGPRADANGRFTTSFTLLRSLSDPDPEFGFDCRAKNTVCELDVQSQGNVEATKVLHFAPGGSVASSAGSPAHVERLASPFVRTKRLAGCASTATGVRAWQRLVARPQAARCEPPRH